MVLAALIAVASMVPIQEAPGERVRGSGVLIHEKLVLTAAHVVDDIPVAGVRCGSKDMAAAVLSMDKTADLAILELAEPCGMPVSSFAPSNAPAGEVVRAEGCPSAKCGWKIFGRVVAYDIVQSGLNNVPRVMLVSDAPIWFGNSGGPLYDSKGRVVGIASQLIIWANEDFSRLFSCFVPAETVIHFLVKQGLV